jgi:hypothetical protein
MLTKFHIRMITNVNTHGHTNTQTMDYLAIILGKARRYEVVSKGCIPVGFILKGIYGSTSVTGEFSFLQRVK